MGHVNRQFNCAGESRSLLSASKVDPSARGRSWWVGIARRARMQNAGRQNLQRASRGACTEHCPAPESRSFPRSLKSLMMIFGAGAPTCTTRCGGGTAFSRLTKVTQPPSRRGHRGRRRAPVIALIHAFGWPHSNAVPSTQMQWRMTAILGAIATFAFFIPML